MDMLSFNAAVASMSRVRGREKVEEAYTAMVAAQGTPQTLKKLIEPWVRASNDGSPKVNEREFLAKFGKGI